MGSFENVVDSVLKPRNNVTCAKYDYQTLWLVADDSN